MKPPYAIGSVPSLSEELAKAVEISLSGEWIPRMHIVRKSKTSSLCRAQNDIPDSHLRERGVPHH